MGPAIAWLFGPAACHKGPQSPGRSGRWKDLVFDDLAARRAQPVPQGRILRQHRQGARERPRIVRRHQKGINAVPGDFPAAGNVCGHDRPAIGGGFQKTSSATPPAGTAGPQCATAPRPPRCRSHARGPPHTARCLQRSTSAVGIEAGLAASGSPAISSRTRWPCFVINSCAATSGRRPLSSSRRADKSDADLTCRFRQGLQRMGIDAGARNELDFSAGTPRRLSAALSSGFLHQRAGAAALHRGSRKQQRHEGPQH